MTMILKKKISKNSDIFWFRLEKMRGGKKGMSLFFFLKYKPEFVHIFKQCFSKYIVDGVLKLNLFFFRRVI